MTSRMDDDWLDDQTEITSQDVRAATLLSRWAAACLLGFWGSFPLFFNYADIVIRTQAVWFLSLLAVPALFVIWIVLTVKAMHRVGMYFFSASSTYWAGGSLVLMFFGVVVLVFLGMNMRGGLELMTVAVFMAICVASVVYVFVLNYRATRLPLLALVVTILQFTAVFSIVVLFALGKENRRLTREGEILDLASQDRENARRESWLRSGDYN